MIERALPDAAFTAEHTRCLAARFLLGDFTPYILKSTDRAKTWTSIASNLPSRDWVWTVIEDPVNKNLLFAGTEFGVYFTLDGGQTPASIGWTLTSAVSINDFGAMVGYGSNALGNTCWIIYPKCQD